jgi:hypothetical protein
LAAHAAIRETAVEGMPRQGGVDMRFSVAWLILAAFIGIFLLDWSRNRNDKSIEQIVFERHAKEHFSYNIEEGSVDFGYRCKKNNDTIGRLDYAHRYDCYSQMKCSNPLYKVYIYTVSERGAVSLFGHYDAEVLNGEFTRASTSVEEKCLMQNKE